jgi:hypothetical protein
VSAWYTLRGMLFEWALAHTNALPEVRSLKGAIAARLPTQSGAMTKVSTTVPAEAEREASAEKLVLVPVFGLLRITSRRVTDGCASAWTPQVTMQIRSRGM